MSKIGCPCGHLIYDQTDSLPYKGKVLRDQDEDDLTENLIDSVQSLVEAEKSGSTQFWIDQRFGAIYPRDLPAGHMIHDMVFLTAIGRGGSLTTIYECQACGRLLVESRSGSGYSVFVPESGRYEQILQSKRRGESD